MCTASASKDKDGPGLPLGQERIKVNDGIIADNVLL